MNRKQRRAQATSNDTNNTPLKSAADIPLTQPDRSSKTTETKTKTLYEIAAEKQAELLPNTQPFDTKTIPNSQSFINIKIGPDGQIIHEDNTTPATSPSSSEPLPPLLDTLFLTTSLTAIHFTLETLTVHQYAQSLEFLPIIKHTLFIAFPTLFLLIHLFHGHLLNLSFLSSSYSLSSPKTKKTIYILQQIIYIIIANISGCYLIQLTNDKGYYAVMKNAPSVGTIWVWSVIELGLVGAVLGVAGPGGFAWWFGYGIY